jgi:DNA-directed DNA polymerase III PolC
MLPAQLAVATPWCFHWGASTVEELAARAAERGVGALGMADRGGLWGAVPFQKACEAAGVKPVFGVRLGPAHLVALDADGWAALCRLSSRWQLAGEERDWQLPRWLAEEGDGFALLSADAALLRGLARERGAAELFATDPRVAAETGLPHLAAPRVAFADAADWERHRLLAAIGANTTLPRLEPKQLAPRSAWLKGPQERAWDSGADADALRRADELAERAAYRIPLGQKQLPRFPVPGGRGALAHLARLCERGMRRRRVPETARERYRAQLHRELGLIDELGFADYFLIVADIGRWARQRGIQNCGRGSAANSLVSWLLGLTHVDPLAHGLYFERFMNRGRSDFPDVDLDFAWDERDAVLDHVYARHGRDHVAMICTHTTFAARGAVRELAKVMGLPPAEIGPVTRALPWHHQGPLDPDELARHPKAAGLPLDAEPWRTILREAGRLDGFPRFLGVHAGGIVLTPAPLTDHLPLARARKETEAGPLVVTQWDMYGVEDAGLVKIDLLGNRGLAVIRDARAAVERNTGLRLDFARLDPKRDSRTCELLERGDTMGCFYVESPGMRGLLRKLRCRSFPALVAASSIIRPGISSSGMMSAYIERHHWAVRHGGAHDDSWYLHPAMRELLAETYGVMTYQEDVMKVAEAIAGIGPAESDGMRRAMTKKRAHQRLERYGERFVAGAVAHGTPRATAEELWRQIESFSGYSFCKAHSASYAEVSFRSAYLRAHFPAEFMAAVLANYGGFYATFAYVAEARRMGLRVALPDVNLADASFTGADGTVRVGLGQVGGLGSEAVRRLLAARAGGGPFAGQDELLARVALQPKELDALIRAGALDRLPDGMTRPERMRAAALWARRRRDPAHGAGGLFPAAAARRPPPAPEYDRRTQLLQEWQALDFLVSAHPLQLFADAIRAAGAVPARELDRHIDQRVRLVGWQVTQKPIRTRAGKPMMFLSFEDTTALYETVLFPQQYRRLAPWTLTRGPYLVEGVPRDEHGAITVEVQELRLLDGAAPPQSEADRRAGKRAARA